MKLPDDRRFLNICIKFRHGLCKAPPKSGFRSGVPMDLDDRRFLNLIRTKFRHEPLFLES